MPHGTTAAISARNTSRFVRFFFAAKSSDAKLGWSMEAPRINGSAPRGRETPVEEDSTG